MIRLAVPVRDILSSMYMPITEQILEKLMNELSLKQLFENKVYINSDATKGSSSTDIDNNPKLKENRLTVDMGYNLNPLTTKWGTTTFNHVMGGPNPYNHEEDVRPIFMDLRTQCTVTEQEVPTNLTLSISMDFTDRVAAIETINRIVTTYTNGEKLCIVDLAYNYPVPSEIYTVLYGIYKLTPMEDSFFEHLAMMSGEVIGHNVNRHDQSGSREIVVKKNLAGVIGQIDFDLEKPEASGSADSTDIYNVTFTLTMQFSRASMLCMSYPIIMMNQPAPEELILVNPNGANREPAEAHPYFSINNYKQLMDYERDLPKETVNIPWYDNWEVPNSAAPRVLGYREFLTLALTLDNVGVVDGTTTIDISQDLPYALVPEVLASYAEQGAASLGFVNKFNISVFANGVAIADSEISFDGTILTIHRQDIFPIYRLVLSEQIGVTHGSLNTLWVTRYDIVAKRQ